MSNETSQESNILVGSTARATPAADVTERVIVRQEPPGPTAQQLADLRPSWRAEVHDALSSKKLWVLILTLVTIGLGVRHGTLSADDGVRDAVIAAGAYFVGQGIADHGKP